LALPHATLHAVEDDLRRLGLLVVQHHHERVAAHLLVVDPLLERVADLFEIVEWRVEVPMLVDEVVVGSEGVVHAADAVGVERGHPWCCRADEPLHALEVTRGAVHRHRERPEPANAIPERLEVLAHSACSAAGAPRTTCRA
jgi:hypothetical protein